MENQLPKAFEVDKFVSRAFFIMISYECILFYIAKKYMREDSVYGLLRAYKG